MNNILFYNELLIRPGHDYKVNLSGIFSTTSYAMIFALVSCDL